MFIKSEKGVDTFVPGTVVQGDLYLMSWLSKGQFTKETLVQGDMCPKKLLCRSESLIKLSFAQLTPSFKPQLGFNPILYQPAQQPPTHPPLHGKSL